MCKFDETLTSRAAHVAANTPVGGTVTFWDLTDREEKVDADGKKYSTLDGNFYGRGIDPIAALFGLTNRSPAQIEAIKAAGIDPSSIFFEVTEATETSAAKAEPFTEDGQPPEQLRIKSDDLATDFKSYWVASFDTPGNDGEAGVSTPDIVLTRVA